MLIIFSVDGWFGRLVSGVIAVVSGFVVFWLPFVAAGNFNVLDKKWNVNPGSLWWVLGFDAGSFSWLSRVFQTVLVFGVVLALAKFSGVFRLVGEVKVKVAAAGNDGEYAMRRKLSLYAFVLPAVIMSVRVSLDSIYYPYYVAVATVVFSAVAVGLIFAGRIVSGYWMLAAVAALQMTAYRWMESRCAGNTVVRVYCETVQPGDAGWGTVSVAYLFAGLAAFFAAMSLRKLALSDTVFAVDKSEEKVAL